MSLEKTKYLLGHASLLEIKDKIDHFGKINLKDIDDSELFNELFDVLTINIDNQKRFCYKGGTLNFNKDTNFYRVRRLDSSDHIIPLKGIKNLSDLWNPPASKVKKRGRLNGINESLLYTSLKPEVAIQEMGIKNGDLFCLIVYKNVLEIGTSNLGIFESIKGLTNDENKKMQLIMNFLDNWFSRKIGIGEEYFYKVSERIAKDYYDLPLSDGWTYNSVVTGGKDHSWNVCLKPGNISNKLILRGAMVCRASDEQGDFMVLSIIPPPNTDLEYLEYYKINSDKCRSTFPEISS